MSLQDNIFEWYFAIRGAWETDFEGGIYIGRILMPAEYPFKPPAFVMHTPSGRFETGTKICLSISSFHPESWQPSWSVRSALVALIAFMQTPGNGAVGSLDTTSNIRKQIALEVRNSPPKVSNAERQEQVNSLHQRLLEMEEESRALYDRSAKQAPPPSKSEEETTIEADATTIETDGAASSQPAHQTPEKTTIIENKEEKNVVQVLQPEVPAVSASVDGTAEVSTPIVAQSTPSPAGAHTSSPTEPRFENSSVASPVRAAAPLPTPSATPETPNGNVYIHTHLTPGQGQPRMEVSTPTTIPAEAAFSPLPAGTPLQPAITHTDTWEDRGLTYLALVLGVLLLAVLLRRVILAFAPSSGNDAMLFSVNPSDIDLEL